MRRSACALTSSSPTECRGRRGSALSGWRSRSRAGEGSRRLGARISADGYSRSVGDVSIEHVLAALDRAEEELLPSASAPEELTS